MAEFDPAFGAMLGEFLGYLYVGFLKRVPDKSVAADIVVTYAIRLMQAQAGRNETTSPFNFVVSADDFERMRGTEKEEDEEEEP